jgi:anti-sigma B factor antagonist
MSILREKAMWLGLDTHQVGRVFVVTVSGEIDLATAPQLHSELAGLLRDGHRQLVLDFAGVEFCDATGLGVLARIRRHACRDGGWLRLAAPRPMMRRLLTLTDLGELVPVYPDVSAALVDQGDVPLSTDCPSTPAA